MEMPSASAAAFVATYFQVMVDHLATSALLSLGDIVLLPCDVGDGRKRYRDPNDVERPCHNLRAGARVFAGNLHLHWEVDPPRRRASVRKVTYWPHILLLQTHIAVTPFGS
jgi:hypothetical protein